MRGRPDFAPWWHVQAGLIVACLLLSGCGAGRMLVPSHAVRTRRVAVHSVSKGRWGARPGVRLAGVRVASERLPDSAIVWFGAQRSYGGRSTLELSDSTEEVRSGRVLRASGSSTAIDLGDYGAEALSVEYGCLDKHEYAVVYGLLRDVRDSVVAEVRGAITPLMEKKLPGDLSTDGTFVYSHAIGWPINLATKTQSGNVVTREMYAGPKVRLCGG
jgi:hypothetical protein